MKHVEDQPIRDPRILEALEACRPGSDDISDPSMALLAEKLAVSPHVEDLYDRVQRTDRALAQAFQDVPVPDGLADRILARLAATSPEPADGLRVLSAAREPAALNEPPEAAVSTPRRRLHWGWYVATGCAALAASLLLAVILNLPRPSADRPEELQHQAIAFFNEDARGTGVLLGIGPPPPGGYPLSRAIPARARQVRWRSVAGFLGRSGVAYDIAAPSGISGTVYVVQWNLSGLGAGPPPTPMLATGQRCTAIWQEGDVLYVLVIEGESRDYERFLLETGGGPVT